MCLIVFGLLMFQSEYSVGSHFSNEIMYPSWMRDVIHCNPTQSNVLSKDGLIIFYPCNDYIAVISVENGHTLDRYFLPDNYILQKLEISPDKQILFAFVRDKILFFSSKDGSFLKNSVDLATNVGFVGFVNNENILFNTDKGYTIYNYLKNEWHEVILPEVVAGIGPMMRIILKPELNKVFISNGMDTIYVMDYLLKNVIDVVKINGFDRHWVVPVQNANKLILFFNGHRHIIYDLDQNNLSIVYDTPEVLSNVDQVAYYNNQFIVGNYDESTVYLANLTSSTYFGLVLDPYLGRDTTFAIANSSLIINDGYVLEKWDLNLQ